MSFLGLLIGVRGYVQRAGEVTPLRKMSLPTQPTINHLKILREEWA